MPSAAIRRPQRDVASWTKPGRSGRRSSGPSPDRIDQLLFDTRWEPALPKRRYRKRTMRFVAKRRGMADAPKPVARFSQIADGTTKRVVIDGEAVLLCKAEGSLYAIEDVCTHDGGELEQGALEGCRIECPRHGAYFDVRTGAALTLPAVEPVRTFPLHVEGDDVYVER